MSKEDVANAFVSHFYTTLDSNPGALLGLYVRSESQYFLSPI